MKLQVLILMCLVGVSFGRGTRGGSRGGCKARCSKEIAPVCGSDGRIYSSMCEMKRINCNKAVHLVNEDKCLRSAGSSCEHVCSSTLDPVCGSDGHVYRNKCFFRAEQCRSGISFAHYGPCYSSTNGSDVCPTQCTNQIKDGPVCASNGNVYKSTCEMQRRTCGQKVVKTSFSHCQTTKNCKDVCFYDYKPVCSSDGRIYQSRCQMKVLNCGKHVFEIPMVHCRPQERTTSSCPLSCESERLDPVCGSDGNIYDSECDMRRLNCRSGSALNVFNMDIQKCRKRFQKCERHVCPTTYDPVCGTDGNTYVNYCILHKAYCRKGVRMTHYGLCPSMSQLEDCSKNCTKEEKNEFPVCGSDGNAYDSICDMKQRACGQRVVAVALHHCAATKHCLSDCSQQKGIAVCGSDGRMYRNTCEMKAKNCGRHIYGVPLGECLKGFRFFHCLRFCPSTFDPVCGTDGKTYSNDCFLSMENCRSRSLGRSMVLRTYYGKCGAPQKQPKLYMFR